jgi:hypothetical protein
MVVINNLIALHRVCGAYRSKWKGYHHTGHVVALLSRHYATHRKFAGSRPDKVKEFFPIYLILPAALGPGVHPASDRNEYHEQKNNVSGE